MSKVHVFLHVLIIVKFFPFFEKVKNNAQVDHFDNDTHLSCEEGSSFPSQSMLKIF